MDFDLTDDQREIKTVARGLLSARSTFPTVRAAAERRAYEDSLRKELIELGWQGIAVDEEFGGQGLGAVELVMLLEELGYACAATPFLASAVVAAVIQAGGSDEQRARWLPGLVTGEITAGIGASELAIDAHEADVVVLIDGAGGHLLVAPQTELIETIDPTRRYAKVQGHGEPLQGNVAARFHTAIAAELLGVSQRALDMTLTYVKERKQFGVPIGSFQAVAHRCAQMLFHTESTRSGVYYAAWAADADTERLPEAAALAAAAASDGGREVTASAIQAHGGIGFTWEADLHWLFKRAQLDAAMLGGSGHHRTALARLAGSSATTRASAS
jgi:alkylation response protein AidB-like acyl-CoA dehydrogenase